jgi:hypothetical protein
MEARRWLLRWELGHSCLIQLAFFRSLLEDFVTEEGQEMLLSVSS